MERRKVHKELCPCVLQDIGPLGHLPKNTRKEEKEEQNEKVDIKIYKE